MATKHLEPIPPGEILREEFMKPLAVSINTLARDLDVPPNGISEIVNGKRAITADTALRLGKYFGVTPKIWLDDNIDIQDCETDPSNLSVHYRGPSFRRASI